VASSYKEALAGLCHVRVCACGDVDGEIVFDVKRNDAAEETWILQFAHDRHPDGDYSDLPLLQSSRFDY
jgi:hypothetical protein